ncbi:cyclin-T1-like [Heliangelus exortis]|uniref:cyclin-T1-like n=1 Tax=Heliangelus exortis TaxID=472823 RepID=UPI003A916452
MAGGMAGGMAGDMAGGMAGGNAGGNARGMARGMAGGMAGDMAGGNAGGNARGMAGGMAGDMAGDMAGGNAGGNARDMAGGNAGGNAGDMAGDMAGGNAGGNAGDMAGGMAGDNAAGMAGGNAGGNAGDSAGGNAGGNAGDMAGGTSGQQWYFSRQQLEQNPSCRAGLEPSRELWYRQQAAGLLQDMGQRLSLSQLTINTSILYMHRFYMVQSFTQFHRNVIAPAALFLAAKVEDQKRSACDVVKVARACLHPTEPPLEPESEAFLQQCEDILTVESIILETLGFETTVEHPHIHVVKCTQLVQASKDIARTAYFLATKSLHLTTFSLRYPPPVVACVCVHLACQWCNWEIPVSMEGKPWWENIDGTVTLHLLDELTNEFLRILAKTPRQLKHIRIWQPKKVFDDSEDEGLWEQVKPSSASAGPSLLPGAERCAEQSSAEVSQPGHCHPSATLEITETDPKNSSSLAAGGSFQHEGTGARKRGGKRKVSLEEYRAKHREELAAHRKQLENFATNLRSQYARAAQELQVEKLNDIPLPIPEQGHQPSPEPPKGHAPHGSSRKRPLKEEVAATATARAGTLEHQPRASKAPRGPPGPSQHLHPSKDRKSPGVQGQLSNLQPSSTPRAGGVPPTSRHPALPLKPCLRPLPK